jgi:hypothetical protein
VVPPCLFRLLSWSTWSISLYNLRRMNTRRRIVFAGFILLMDTTPCSTQSTSVFVQLLKADPDHAQVLCAAYRTYSSVVSKSIRSLGESDSAQIRLRMACKEMNQGYLNGTTKQESRRRAV